MGGSRCSYRNCSMRSGITKVHMFHFPVYDKNRCHQWLANAQKFEFLNLKLSQLRNRIVCQYHFKDDCFMNYKKDKLTHNAVPTEDGPHCKPTESTESQETASSIFPLILNETEGDDKYIKKHKSSIIYADFLTNGDYWEKKSLNETIWNNKVITNKASSLGIDIPPSKDEPVENSSITLPNTCSDGVSTKIFEIESPMDCDIKNAMKENISDQIVNNASQNVTTDTIKKSLCNRKTEYSLNDFLVSTEPLNFASNQDLNNITTTQTVNKMHLPQNVNKMPSNQENNNIAILDELNSSNNVVNEQFSDLQWSNNPKSIQPTDIQNTVSSAPILGKTVVLESPKDIPIQFEPIENFNFVPYERQNDQDVKEKINIKPKIKILFEEKIKEPIKLPDKLEPISPSMVINISSIKDKTTDFNDQITKKRNKSSKSLSFGNVTKDNIESSLQKVQHCNNNSTPIDINPQMPTSERKRNMSNKSSHNVGDVTKHNMESSLQMVQHSNNNITPIDFNPKMPTSEPKRNKRNKSSHNFDVTKENIGSSLLVVQRSGKPTEIIPKMPAVKHKISPERIAAIEKKRNFNKKLRDLVETCLEKLDEHERTSENVTDAYPSSNGKVSTDRINALKQNVGSYLSKQTELPNEHEYSMKYIEARMQRMEDVLLNKIEDNSRKIVELKKCIVTKPQAHKSSGTQTSANEESYKKQLYQEMSKYLSPNANSLVYEELFINRYAQKNINQPSPRKRKRR